MEEVRIFTGEGGAKAWLDQGRAHLGLWLAVRADLADSVQCV